MPPVGTGKVFSVVGGIANFASDSEKRVDFLSQVEIGFSYEFLAAETLVGFRLIHKQCDVAFTIGNEETHVGVVDQILYRINLGRSKILEFSEKPQCIESCIFFFFVLEF